MILRYNQQKISTRQSLNLFIAGVFILPNYIHLMGRLSSVIGFNTKITTYIYYCALWILLLLSLPMIFRAITSKMIFGMVIVVLFAAGQYLLFPESRDYIWGTPPMDLLLFYPQTLLAVVPYILIGAAVTDMNALHRILHTSARIGIALGALAYMVAIAEGQNVHYDDMNNAYAMCVMVCLLIADWQKQDVYFLLAGGFSLLMAGTRGPLVCVVVAVVLRTVLMETLSTKRVLKIIAGIVLAIALQSGLLLILVELISNGFAAVGISELRIVDYIREGILTDSSGRDQLTEIVVQKLWNSPILGYGVGGDRTVLMSNTYVHNILLEMWISYGIIAGTAVLYWMAYWLLKGVRSRDQALSGIAVGLFSSVVVKLFMSSSYLYSKELFLLLGICMAGCAIQRKKQRQSELE